MKNGPWSAAPKWLGILGAFAERLERMAPAQVRNANRVLGFNDKQSQISADALDQDPLQIWYYLDRYPKEKALAHVLPILVGYLRERGQHFPTLTMIAAWLDPKSDNEWRLWLERRPGAPTSIQGYAKYHRWRLAIDQTAAKLGAASVTSPTTHARSELADEDGVNEKTIEHGLRLARQGLVRKRKRRR
jgi:hypothetical protein